MSTELTELCSKLASHQEYSTAIVEQFVEQARPLMERLFPDDLRLFEELGDTSPVVLGPPSTPDDPQVVKQNALVLLAFCDGLTQYPKNLDTPSEALRSQIETLEQLKPYPWDEIELWAYKTWSLINRHFPARAHTFSNEFLGSTPYYDIRKEKARQSLAKTHYDLLRERLAEMTES